MKNIPGTFEDSLDKEIDAIGWHNVLARFIYEYEKSVQADNTVLHHLDCAEDELRKIDIRGTKSE